MNKIIITAVAASVVLGSLAQERGRMQANPEAKLHRFSTTVEKERPQLNKETRDLIAAYRRDLSDANRVESRKSAVGYPNVTFRVVREDGEGASARRRGVRGPGESPRLMP